MSFTTTKSASTLGPLVPSPPFPQFLAGTAPTQGAPGLAPETSESKELSHPTPSPTTTELRHALALQLLNRYGILTRESVASENILGGFSAVYDVLKALKNPAASVAAISSPASEPHSSLCPPPSIFSAGSAPALQLRSPSSYKSPHPIPPIPTAPSCPGPTCPPWTTMRSGSPQIGLRLWGVKPRRAS